MKIEIINEDYLLEMSNVRGNYVKVPHKLPFSFYFSSGVGNKHSIRVKPSFNPEKLKRSMTGTLQLSGDWEYTPNSEDINVSSKDVESMKKFFKDNIVFFILVWDEFLQDAVVQDYFLGNITIHEVIEDLDFYKELSQALDECVSVLELETCIRDNLEYLHELGYNVNFYGN